MVCRQLGYSDAEEAILEAEFGAGSGRIWLDDVECIGNESYLSNCSFPGWGVANCTHSSDAGVICVCKFIPYVYVYTTHRRLYIYTYVQTYTYTVLRIPVLLNS